MEIELKIIDERMRTCLPTYATDGSAALDLRASVWEPFHILPGEVQAIRAGVAIHIKDPRYAGIILPRSGLGVKGLVLANTIGLIDSDYQGELLLSVWNRSNEEIVIQELERIAQLAIVPIKKAYFTVVDEFKQSARGDKGFGSTGLL